MRRLVAAVLAILASGLATSAPEPSRSEWVTIDYSTLVDRDLPTHSGESVGALLDRLGGRGWPAAGERREDDLVHRLLDPILEPYAYVLADTVDSLQPAPDPPMVEVAGLWTPGEAEPGWVELLRARRYLVESDGRGSLRVFLPWPEGERRGAAAGPISRSSVDAARESWREAWPVLRLVLAAERRRLAKPGATKPALDVEVRAYRHLRARSTFDLGVVPWRTKVAATEANPQRAAFDLETLAQLLGRRARIEGARLEPNGTIRWFASDAPEAPRLLGRPMTIADAAIAYRAVFHGGLADPYMSLDRGRTPWIAAVNFGGRLRDTSIGLVSLLCDVRFKTVSLGLDPFSGEDVRERLRREADGFRSHLDRFAADPTSTSVLGQQTRFWFYPDGVDLTLSPEGDLFALRRTRMTAASERVDAAAKPAGERDPPWTRDTVAFVNDRFEALARSYPELTDLDESARLLAAFAWLRAAREGGLTIPDLDVLLDVELPAEPTPRRFPHVLTHDTLPPQGSTAAVEVLDSSRVGEALERLQPRGDRPLPLSRRFRRALAALDPRAPDHATLIGEMEQAAAQNAPSDLRATLAYRAERLAMHRLVLQTAPAPARAAIERRRAAGEAVRVFSVGIGGIDLGMNAAIARAARRSAGIPGSSSGATPGPAQVASADSMAAATRRGASAPAEDPPSAIPTEPAPGPKMREHGLATGAESSRAGGYALSRGAAGPSASIRWTLAIYSAWGPEIRSRRRVQDPQGGLPVFERVEDGRFVSFRFERAGDKLRSIPAIAAVPVVGESNAAPVEASAVLPDGLANLEIIRPDRGEEDEPATLRLRVRGPGSRDVAADLPRMAARRLVLGRDLDTTPDRPLPALGAPEALMSGARELMVMLDSTQTRPPWFGASFQVAGEEDASRIAQGLRAWWTGTPRAGGVVVGTSRDVSPRRWAASPPPAGKPSLVVPAEAFPGARAPWRAKTLEALGGESEGAGVRSGAVVVLVSAEAPGVLGARLAELARDPAMKGKLLAVAALSSAVRADLPAALLGEGNLTAVGVFSTGPVGLDRAISQIAAFVRAVGTPAAGTRVEEIPGPFLWYY